jgi:hypothetical protein
LHALQVNERHIPTFRIMHQGKGAVEEEEHHYPFAGGQNPVVRLGVIELQITQESDGASEGTSCSHEVPPNNMSIASEGQGFHFECAEGMR